MYRYSIWETCVKDEISDLVYIYIYIYIYIKRYSLKLLVNIKTNTKVIWETMV